MATQNTSQRSLLMMNGSVEPHGQIELLRTMAKGADKVDKSCYVRFTDKDVYFVASTASSDTSVGAFSLWSKMNKEKLFSSFEILREFAIQIDAVSFIKALKGVAIDRRLKIDVTRSSNTFALMVLTTITEGSNGGLIQVKQDIPVKIVPLSANILEEPMIEDPEVSIILPSLGRLRAVTERIKHLEDVVISADNNGNLSFTAESDLVEVDIRFTDQGRPEIALNGDLRTGYSRVRISTKDFLKFLQSYQVEPSRVVCCKFVI